MLVGHSFDFEGVGILGTSGFAHINPIGVVIDAIWLPPLSLLNAI